MAKEQPIGKVYDLQEEKQRRQSESIRLQERKEKIDKILDSILNCIAAQHKFIKALEQQTELFRSQITELQDKLASLEILPIEEGREFIDRIKEYRVAIEENDKVKATVLRRLEQSQRDLSDYLEQKERL